ncbi:MAG: DNA adenine methylase [Planctomycetota bacterium]
MPTTPSPLRYPGGKTVYADIISWIIQNNGLSGCSYAEPFAGGAGAAITLLLKGQVKDIWLNDFDPAIYSFWRAILKHTEEFISRIDNTPITVCEWRKQKEIYVKKGADLLSLGFATFFLNRCNRAGILRANPIGGLMQNSTDKIDARFKKKKLIAKIQAIAEQKGRIHLFKLDALDFMKELKKTQQKTLVYFDPPYYKKGELLYLNHYRHKDHESLCKQIVTCRMPWLLSYDDQPEITGLYRGVRTYRRNLRYSVATPSVGRELIISNLRMPEYLETIEKA